MKHLIDAITNGIVDVLYYRFQMFLQSALLEILNVRLYIHLRVKGHIGVCVITTVRRNPVQLREKLLQILEGVLPIRGNQRRGLVRIRLRLRVIGVEVAGRGKRDGGVR